ncbi:MAG: hypothetical protein E5W15_26900 [Mesorhizobium sp.]|nr:MAG: hypothetical protein E5W15_26900 [Mesorhizobium sp.]
MACASRDVTPYCPTALLPYCPTALSPYCPTALLPFIRHRSPPAAPAYGRPRPMTRPALWPGNG